MKINHNNLLWTIVVLGVLIVIFGVGGNFFIEKISNRVIQKLQRDYSPSPYGPGIDPDKLNMQDVLK
jgi:hypothetical protein